MLITGCSNSLLTKFQDKQCVGNCDAPANQRKYFDQPVIQTIQMFIAEMCVGFVLLYNYIVKLINSKSSRNGYQEIQDSAEPDDADLADDLPLATTQPKLDGKRVFLLAIPAFCDLLATTMMNVGLLLVPVSIYQMVRGAIVLFVGAFSVIFLKRRLFKKQWIGLVSVFGGVFIVGISAMFASSSSVEPNSDDTNITAPINSGAALEATFGVLMILIAQLFSATQFVVEEFILEKYSMAPLNVVLWEGVFGTSASLFGSLFIANVLMGKEAVQGSMFNLSEGFDEMFSTKTVLISSFIILFMMSTFNVTGMTVTRVISATSRSTIDTSRTVGIWLVSLLIGWESFKFLQLAGFLLLVYGTLLFNGIIGNDKEIKENVEELLPNEFEHT